MSRRRAELPDVTHRHLNRLQVINETGYDTRALRSIVVRALRAQGMRVAGAVRVVYSGAAVNGHHGCAALGRNVRHHGLNMSLSLPRDPGQLDVGKFARVVRHEAMHWRGIRHVDMTEDQLYCRGSMPEWAEGVVIAHRERSEPTADDRREQKLAHARSMLKRAETRLKRAATVVKRWERRAVAAERAVERSAAEPKVLAAAPMAADSQEGAM